MLTCLISCLRLCFARIYVFVCFSPCFMLISASVHAYMLGFSFLYVYVLAFTCSHTFCTCLCLNLHFYMLVCLDLCSLHALCYLPCAYALHAMFVCLGLELFCHSMCYCSPFCCIIFLSCVLAYWLGHDLNPMLFVIIHTPWPISKGLDHPFFMSMLACSYALCLC